MIGMVIVTHGRLAAEFRAAMEHVVGVQTQVATVMIGPEDDMDMRRTASTISVRRMSMSSSGPIITVATCV